MTGHSEVQGTGDPGADAILDRLEGLEDASPDEEYEIYRTTLDSLSQLLEDQPRLPGMS